MPKRDSVTGTPIQKYQLSIIVQRDATMYSFITFLQTALYVSDDTLIHHQEHTKCNYNIWHCSNRICFVQTPPRQRTVANTVRPVPYVVITV